MRVLFCHRPGGAFGYITDSLINAFRDKGHVVERWDGKAASWDKFDPDMYYGSSGHRQPIPGQRRCKVALHVNPYGPVNIKGINESDDNIKWVVTQKPDVVFGYGTSDDRLLWDYWTTKLSIPWVPMPNAGDTILFKKVTDFELRPFDIVYLGGRWAYKARTIDPYLISLLKSGSVTYKLHGWGDWPAGICSGLLPDDEVCSLFNKGRVAPCIAEEHTHRYGIDLPERAFKVALCGAIIIHDSVPALKKILPNALVASTPDEFRDMCIEYSRPENTERAAALAERQRTDVLNGNTYHHRAATLLQALGFADASRQMIN